MRNAQLIERLRQKLLETFRPLIATGHPVALIDYPDHKNCGDHAIWLGEKALLRELGVTVAYECSMRSYDRAEMASAIASNTILMHGGGNFGDIYGYQQFRHQVLTEFPDNKVLVLPQTVMFYSDRNLMASRALFAAHRDVTIAARDVLSLHVLRRYFGENAKIVLAPDTALMLGARSRHAAPSYDIVWLSRTDIESAFGAQLRESVALPDLCETEFKLTGFSGGADMAVAADVAGTKLMVTDWRRCEFSTPAGRAAFQTFDRDQRSSHLVDLAFRMLGAGKVVITDRLHGHILCVLAGISHVLLNNSYGKMIPFYETWSRPLEGCRLANSPAHAWQMAQEMVGEMAGSDGPRGGAAPLTASPVQLRPA